MPFALCKYCQDFGYVQIYRTIVMRVYCDCKAGDKRIQEKREMLEEMGIDPDSSDFKWTRASDLPKYF